MIFNQNPKIVDSTIAPENRRISWFNQLFFNDTDSILPKTNIATDGKMASQKESLAPKYQFSGWRNVGFREGNSKLFHIPILPIYFPFRNIWLLTLQLAQLRLKSFLFFDQPQWFDVPGHGNHTKTRSWVRKEHESLNGAVTKIQPNLREL